MSIGSISNSYQSPYMTFTNTEKSDENKTEDSSTGSADNSSTPMVAPASFWNGNASLDGLNEEAEKDFDSFNPSVDLLSNLSFSAAQALGKSSVTFNDLLEYRDILTAEFSKKMEEGLKAAGVADDADFRISLNADGEIEVKSNHADKAKIEKYFADNPDLAADYQEIESLSKLEQTRKTQDYDMKAIYTQGRALSMSSLMMNQAPTNMAVTGGGSLASILSGGGINTRV